MKHCPTCRRSFPDSLKFCKSDGTPLAAESAAAAVEGVETRQFSAAHGADTAATRILPTAEVTDVPSAATTLLEAQPAAGRTRELAGRKSRRGILVAAVAAVAALAVAAAYLYLPRGRSAPPKNSVAVLPFANDSSDPEAEYLSDGITESLINSLSRLPDVRVMARTTMFTFKGKEANPQEVGRRLGVETVLTGRVVLRGDSLTVQADLVNVADGSQAWGGRYSRKLTDVLAVQNEIAREVLGELRTKLSGAEERRLSGGYTQDAEAYRLYLTGRHLLNSGAPDGLQKGVEYFQQAVARDPDFALGYAGIADAYTLLATTYTATIPPREAMPKAREAAERALALDPTLSEARTSLAWVKYRFDWDWPGAGDEFRRAIELNPNNALAHQWYSDYLMAMGRFDEALAEIRRARELDPLSIFINWSVGRLLFHARRHDEALVDLRRTLEMNPNFPRTHGYLENVYRQQGLNDEALEEHLKVAALTGVSPERIAATKGAYEAGGWKAVEAKELGWLLEDAERRYVPPFVVAALYSRLGDKDRALEWLNKSVEERDGTLVYLKIDQRWDFVRTDPRFAALVRKVGLPQ